MFRGVIPCVCAAAVLYAFLAPPRFALGNGYTFSPLDRTMEQSVVIEQGGRILAGPGRLRIWGRFPYIYGTSDNPEFPYFILNIEGHTFQQFSRSDEDKRQYGDFLQRHHFRETDTVSIKELYDGSKERRLTLKHLLTKRNIWKEEHK